MSFTIDVEGRYKDSLEILYRKELAEEKDTLKIVLKLLNLKDELYLSFDEIDIRKYNDTLRYKVKFEPIKMIQKGE